MQGIHCLAKCDLSTFTWPYALVLLHLCLRFIFLTLSNPFSLRRSPRTLPIPANSVTSLSPMGSATKLRCFCDVEDMIYCRSGKLENKIIKFAIIKHNSCHKTEPENDFNFGTIQLLTCTVLEFESMITGLWSILIIIIITSLFLNLNFC